MFPCIWRARGLIMPSKQFLCPSAAKACISRDKAPRREVRLETALNEQRGKKLKMIMQNEKEQGYRRPACRPGGGA